MNDSLRIKSTAAKALKKLNKSDRLRIVDAIDSLRQNPHVGDLLKGEFTGLRRIRIGNYRVIYEVFEHELVILVIRVAHRRKAYRH